MRLPRGACSVVMYAAVCFFPAIAGLAAQTRFPDMESDPRAVEYAALGAKGYTWQDYAGISLWASMVHDSSVKPVGGVPWAAQLQQIVSAAAELKAAPDLPADEKARGEYVLTWIHKKFLRKYQALQTRIDMILSTGRYNCVSSAVFYLVLARSAGLNVRGVVTKDHAFVSVRAGNEWIDVETTNPYGFDPGNRKEFHDQFGSATGFVYVPARNYRDRTNISPLELVSLILHNRIAALEYRSQYAQAVPLAIDQAALLKGRGNPAPKGSIFADPDEELMDRLFNYGGQLLNNKDEEDALAWAAMAEKRYPDPARWAEFRYAAINNLTLRLVKANQFPAAQKALDAEAANITAIQTAALQRMITDGKLAAWSRAVKQVSDAAPVLQAVDQAEADGSIGADRAAELRTYVISRAAGFYAAKKDWTGGAKYLEDAITRYGSNRNLEMNLNTMYENRVSDIHNAFARAYNSKSFDQAQRVLSDGLKLFPDNRQLLQDKSILDKTER